MKKYLFIFMLMVIFIPRLTLAVTFQEIFDAPIQYTTEPFSTATGKSIFTIDAEVFVPEGEYIVIPLYEVELYSFSEENIKQMATILGHDANKIKKENIPPLQAWQSNWIQYYQSNKNSFFAVNLTYNQQTGKPRKSLLQFRLEPKGKRPKYITNGQVLPISARYIEDTDLNKASELANNIATELAPELSLYSAGITDTEVVVDFRDIERFNIQGDIKLPSNEDMPKAYIFFFTRNFNGIPTIYTNEPGHGYDIKGDRYTDDFYPYEQLKIVIAQEEVGAVEYMSPYTIKGIWKEDAGELLSFEQIATIGKTILPLKYASGEHNNLINAQYQIHRIAFGYTRVMIPNEPERCIMIPVWDFFGTTKTTLIKGSSSGFNITESLLTINAVTGDIIDRSLGY